MLEQQQIKGMSLADFMEQYEVQSFELIDDKLYIIQPMTLGINKIQKAIYLKFLLYIQNSAIGEIYSGMPIVILNSELDVSNVYKPSLAFFTNVRLNQYFREVEDYENKPMQLVPDIVVEVVSPTDAYSDVNRKVRAYLNDGVKIIWVVDPALKTVAEYTQWHLDAVTKQGIDSLSGHDVAEGFELKVSEIFV